MRFDPAPSELFALARYRVHEAEGPGRRSFALLQAARHTEALIWIIPGHAPHQPMLRGLPEGVGERLHLIRPLSETDLLWAAEEALRSEGVGLVIAEPEPLPVTETEPTPIAAPEPPAAPKVLDPGTRARVQALETQIAKLSENLDNARTTITEATAFHTELAAIFKAEEEKAAAMKAAEEAAAAEAAAAEAEAPAEEAADES